MRVACGCGFEGYTEGVNMTCPRCHGIMALPRMIDFEEFRPVLEEAMRKIRASVIEHGDWSGLSEREVFEKVAAAFDEYRETFVAEVLNGQHRQINSLGDVIAAAVKGVRRLECIKRLEANN